MAADFVAADSKDLGPTLWDGMFRRLLAEPERREAPERDATTALLPAAVYQDPQRFEAERDQLFRRLPLCLGHVDQLREPGSMLAREVIGVPLLLIRDAGENIGVFLNACRHRGARLLREDE